MNWLRSPRQLALGVSCLLVLIAAYLLLAPYQLPSAKPLGSGEAGWALSESISIQSDEALSVIGERRLWGASTLAGQAAGLPAAGPAVEAPLTPMDWRIAGVFAASGRPSLMMMHGDIPLPTTLHVGDKLPGGAVLLEIKPDRIRVRLQGREAYLSTHKE